MPAGGADKELLVHKIHKFLRLSVPDRWLLLEAAGWLAFCRLALLLVPFRRLAPYLNRPLRAGTKAASGVDELPGRAAWAVQTASRQAPWECRCLVQALAARMMLRRRGVSSTLYLGVGKDEAQRFCAHAWLQSGELIVTGEHDLERFNVLSTFPG